METLARRGDRFNAPVQAIPPQQLVPPNPRKIVLPAAVAIALALLLMLGAIWWANLDHYQSSEKNRIGSLAVLPLENLAHDPEQQYFSDGMTNALIAGLCKIHPLRVISRTSTIRYKGTNKTLPQIARELNVDAIIEGSVLRPVNRVRIGVELIEAKSDKHLWAEISTGMKHSHGF